jgi:dienelactone hydrolase
MRRSLLAAAAISGAVLAACAPSGGGHSLLGDPTPVGGQAPVTAPPPSAYTAPTTTTTAPTTTTLATTTTTAAPPLRPYSVGWTLLDLTDPSRPTAFKLGRHLPTYVFYPAVGPGGGAETHSAPGLGRAWPIVIFAGGYKTSLADYHDVVHHLAAAGFVVAMPLFPLATAGGPLNENDLVNEPGDITFVLDQVIAAGSSTGVLHGMVDGSHVALIGQSDGGEAVLGAAYLPGQVGARASVIIAGAAAGVLLGNHGSSDVPHDVMIIQSTADTINPQSYGDRLFATTGSPKAYLLLLNAPHLEPWSVANQWHGVVETSIVDWLDEYIPDLYSGSATARLTHDANVPGTSVIRLA